MNSKNHLTFGKYNGLTINEVYSEDQQYLQWLNTQPWYQIKFKESHEKLIQFLNEKKENISSNPDTIIIYTDGACKNNGSKTKVVRAGAGVHFSDKNKIKMTDVSLKLEIDDPTNNKAELTAIVMALQECNKNKIQNKIIIYTDSKYSIDAITKWFGQWVKNNQLESKKNIDLLKTIHELLQYLDVSFEHIRSHTNLQDEHSIGNDTADKLAIAHL